MYAVLRDLHYDTARLSRASAQLREFQQLHASQPGYRGSLTVDLGNGRRVAVNLWDTEAEAIAARDALAPSVQRLLEPLLVAPAQLIGAGAVVESDIAEL